MKRGCLVAGAIAGAILGLLFVRAVHQAREAARRSQCIGHLKWIAVALHNYHSEFGTFPVGTVSNPALPPERRLAWTILDWPWLGDSGARVEFDRTKAWDEPPNWPPKLTAAPNMTFVDMVPEDTTRFATCPDDPAERYHTRPFPLTYVGVAGVGADAPTLPMGHPRAGVFGYDRATPLGAITDGTSQTVMLLETARETRSWSAGGPSSVRGVDPATRPYIGRGRPFGGYHPGGANAAFADGSVRFIKSTMDPAVLEALSTISGGEPVPAEWDR